MPVVVAIIVLWGTRIKCVTVAARIFCRCESLGPHGIRDVVLWYFFRLEQRSAPSSPPLIFAISPNWAADALAESTRRIEVPLTSFCSVVEHPWFSRFWIGWTLLRLAICMVIDSRLVIWRHSS